MINKYAVWFGLVWLTFKIISEPIQPNQCGLDWIG